MSISQCVQHTCSIFCSFSLYSHGCILCKIGFVYASISRLHFEQKYTICLERSHARSLSLSFSRCRLLLFFFFWLKANGHLCVSFILCHRKQIQCLIANVYSNLLFAHGEISAIMYVLCIAYEHILYYINTLYMSVECHSNSIKISLNILRVYLIFQNKRNIMVLSICVCMPAYQTVCSDMHIYLCMIFARSIIHFK